MAKQVLIVDDSASMRQMMEYTIKSSGHDVDHAVDGDDGYQKTQDKDYDLVITDVNMPNRDGITLVKDLRSQPGYKFTPILLLTTESGEEIKAKGKEAGATGWLVKPFNPEKLIATVEKVLSS